MSGYQIKELISRTIGHFWNEGYGQIYPTLKALATAGLVSSRVEPGNGKPDSHIYSLTDAGWDELRQWLARPVDSHHPGRSELLLKLFFGRHAATDTNLDHVRRHRQMLDALIAQYEAIEVELEGEDDPDQPYWLITLRHGLHVTRASRAWCDETIDQLTQLGEEQP
ncbi:MAG: PadR family transcriptional regulator [Chloroflexota bacterium]|nr:PadR family transcriptional regulator [Chloroflexota bacterium]